MIDLQPACRRLSELVARIGGDQLGNRTPCTQYSVRYLLDHVDEGARGFAQAASTVDEAAGAALDFDGDWRQVLGHRLHVLGKAWDDPAAWAGQADLGGLELPNEVWGRIALTEVVVHGWDLSKATGLPFVLPEETTQACYDHVAGFLAQPPVPELWGPPVEVHAEAPLMDRLVGIAGRRP
ncbi:TIGR03086 family metal-binding protein [Streptomyces sp. SID13031]|uniref:TIGR03086 family metal-binding protein n=1 Tax=Streptomyces sp. SID13031 TaxID=2706046 RepID=UPI0013C86D69|nr:TIGR03086 family metal-binding protein [Streptomyces sp. SID13031]NEA34825.1 TIGR03086 family protein [Streptomyces sp. SID13031]